MAATSLVTIAIGNGLVANAFAQSLPTTGTVKSRLGNLEFVNGFPTNATVRKIYDDLDFQRACQAYIRALPYMAMTEWQRWTREEFGAGNLGYVDYLDFKDKLGILTANATTPYAQAFPNLILGPGHPDINPDGYFVFRSPTNNVWSGQRGLDTRT